MCADSSKGRLVATSNDKRTPAQLRAAELRAQAAGTDRRRRLVLIAVCTVAGLGVIAAFVALALKKPKTDVLPPPVVAQSGQPLVLPAPTGANVSAAVKSAGLQVLGQEMLAFHIHSHLQVSNDGVDVVLPANIGIEPGVGLSPLHTHDATGLVHIESEKQGDYTLGQVFKEWNVPLSATCVSTLCADATHEVKVFVDGKAVTDDPTSIKLADQEKITVAYVTKGKEFTPDLSYKFAP